ncbi:hypothetical protein HYW53_00190 [Candidatus Giovannonibacteria bacterium]|nr:hypothetical protein [Candidatus Giovannonibacteria bacterium]
MKLRFDNFNKNLLDFMRNCGYVPIDRTPEGELNCVKSLMGGDYPRFHCYVKEEGNTLFLNLHLDQKKPSYSGSSRHSGDYEGEVVTDEAVRIQGIYLKN